jgi:hypothetical protein
MAIAYIFNSHIYIIHKNAYNFIAEEIENMYTYLSYELPVIVDDIVKLLLALAVTFSLAGISFQIMRLISKATDMMQDLRKAVQNISTASDMMVEDYSDARKAIKGMIGLMNNINDSVIERYESL